MTFIFAALNSTFLDLRSLASSAAGEVVQAAEELWGEIQEIAWDHAAQALDLTEELLAGAAADGALEVRAEGSEHRSTFGIWIAPRLERGEKARGH